MLVSRLQQRIGHVQVPRCSGPVLSTTSHHRGSCRRQVTSCAAAVQGALQHKLALHLGDTTLQVPCTPQQGQQLNDALNKLLQTFSEKQAATRPKRWDALEVRFRGEAEAGAGMELLEVFCNPNSFKNAFDAKLMVSIKTTGGLTVMSEGRLSNIKADIDAYLSDL